MTEEDGKANGSERVINVNDLQTLPDSYWGMRLRKFIAENKDDPKEAYAKTKEAITNDSAAWGVFAALLMTIGAAALTVGKGDLLQPGNSFVTVQYVLYNTLAFALSFVSVVIGTEQYAYYNNIPAEMIDEAIACNKQLPLEPMIYVAILSQGAGVLCGVNLLYEFEDWSAIFISIIAVILLALVKYKQQQSYKALGLVARGFCSKGDDAK